jgi:hypothetical protein
VTVVSHVSAEFWEQYNALPAEVQRQADKAYRLFTSNPSHPSINLKKVGPFWSARISLEYRVLGYQEDHEFFWFWIGPHDEYDKILKRG